ncbi:hypothetical protein COEREDRAFT_92193 [Coemansia reversa NRRL 1564]|uniref:Uncharacterized protein n=1 Tax=Coemansia reversa (strain ATCC 12441 / NRRL 1564) TaxID=763665 RepID=A0A2G5BDP5_COERN|nr:hypothetical protein COEREDRAFT_92193 [Coemansia reversa NRRL 1564]|eukprot:PIA17138.1 hypothetical protein COEREDRAFT_92193 [Coemansia reversa NRRL 1564]
MPFLSIFVGSTVGLGTAMYAMGLQSRPVLKPHVSYAIYIVAGGFIGYKVFEKRQHQRQIASRRREVLIERRDKRLEEARARMHAETASAAD